MMNTSMNIDYRKMKEMVIRGEPLLFTSHGHFLLIEFKTDDTDLNKLLEFAKNKKSPKTILLIDGNLKAEFFKVQIIDFQGISIAYKCNHSRLKEWLSNWLKRCEKSPKAQQSNKIIN